MHVEYVEHKSAMYASPFPDMCARDRCLVGALHLALLSVIWQLEGYVSAM